MTAPGPRIEGKAPARAAGARRPERFRNRYGPWAVVTGASSGIGRALAESLAATGVSSVLVARRADALHELAQTLTRHHPVQARVVAADLTDPAGVSAACAAADDLEVGLLIAAAGFGTSGPFLDADPAAEQQMLALNCGAALAMTHHYGQRLARRGRGGVILLASLVGRQGTPWAAHYAATKAYIQVLGEGLHRELAGHGVDVLVAAPGPVHSGFADQAGMRMRAAAQPNRIAAATLNALGHHTITSPGLLSKALTWSLAPAPRPLRTTVMSVIMHDMHRPPDARTAHPGADGDGDTRPVSPEQPPTA